MEAPRTSWTYLKANWHSIELKLEEGKVLLREIEGQDASPLENSCTIAEFQAGQMQDLVRQKMPEAQVEELFASIEALKNAPPAAEKKGGFWKRMFGG
jgi:hypothetical protein